MHISDNNPVIGSKFTLEVNSSLNIIEFIHSIISSVNYIQLGEYYVAIDRSNGKCIMGIDFESRFKKLCDLVSYLESININEFNENPLNDWKLYNDKSVLKFKAKGCVLELSSIESDIIITKITIG